MKAGRQEQAQLRATNAIRKKNEALNLMKLASRVDAAASRVQTAVTMNQVTGSMASVVRGLDRAAENANLQQISLVMDKFEQQFEDIDVQTQYLEGAVGGATTLTVPQDQVDDLMKQTADETGLELREEIQQVPAQREQADEEQLLSERLQNHRNAA